MFSFLKDKIKSAISKISKKVEEEPIKEGPIEEKKIEKPKKEKVEKPKVKKEEKRSAEKEASKKVEKPKVKKEEINGVKITYFVHGTTLDNENGISTGQAHGELSNLGKKQAIELRNQTNIDDFDVVFTSDLKRAADSANLTFKDSKIKVITDERLRECNYGDLNQSAEDNIVYLDHVNEKFPDGESLKDVEERITSFLNNLLKNYYGKHVAIVSHKAPQLAFEVLLNEKSWELAINEDWRLKKEWQPGWLYYLNKEIEIKKQEQQEEKKGFFSKLKEKFTGKKDEVEEQKEKSPQTEEVTEEKKGIFGLIKEKITTTKIAEDKFNDLFYELELALLENNVAFEVVEKIKEDLRKDIVEKPIKRGEVEKAITEALKNSIEDLFDVEKIDIIKLIKEKKEKPFIVCVIGQNGSGKTTSIAKIAHLLRGNSISVALAAADTFRKGSIQQLEEWGRRLKVKVIAHDYGSDPAAVSFDGLSYCKAHNTDVLLIDTAGRQHSNRDLMRELEKVVRVSKPDFKLFVGESLTGSDAVAQAQDFNQSVGIDGIILTKSDVDEKGGAIISISFVTHKPIIYLGVGQNISDLEEFDKSKIIKQLNL